MWTNTYLFSFFFFFFKAFVHQDKNIELRQSYPFAIRWHLSMIAGIMIV